jgi:hypothetical protein
MLSDNLDSGPIGQNLLRERLFLMSFPHRRESSLFRLLWTPAFAGVTVELGLHLPF